MYDYVRDHAIKNVWCSPAANKYYNVKLARLTRGGGAVYSHKVIHRTYYLPDKTSRWHVYQVGQLNPLLLGLSNPVCNAWMSFSDACNTKNLVSDIVTVSGVSLPRFDTYYMFNEDKDFIVAVKENVRIYNFDKDDIYIRVYSNGYYASHNKYDDPIGISVSGMYVKSTNDINAMAGLLVDGNSKSGYAYAFVNGLLVNKITTANTRIDDAVEVFFDASIYKVKDYSLTAELSFNSTLDNKRKYLLHYPGAGDDIIDYVDNVDAWVYEELPFGYERGLFYHRLNPDAMRMLTHKDYSVVVGYVNEYARILQTKSTAPVDLSKIKIRLHIRKTDFKRPLIYEASRIKELYKMKDSDVVRAFLGLDSVVPVWRADQLEQTAYVELMGSDCCDITPRMVEDGYGYNQLSKVLGESPIETVDEGGTPTAKPPYLMTMGSTAYEYTEDGVLTGYYYHPSGDHYACKRPDTARVEFISGRSATLLSDRYGKTNIPINPNAGHRVYYCTYVANKPTYEWVDITDDPRYEIIDNTLVWMSEEDNQYLMVRSDECFLAYDYTYKMVSGVLELTITHNAKETDIPVAKPLEVPFGDLDIIINGKSLIKDIDYILDFPKVYVISKEHLVDPLNKEQVIHIRSNGFCHTNMTMRDYTDRGFIEHGFLSNNKSFDLRDDRVCRIIVNGRYKNRDDLMFSEDHSGVSVINSTNGQPYCIKSAVVPLKWLSVQDTYALKDRAAELDNLINGYLSLKIPQPPRDAPTANVKRYQLYSPFISKLIFDIKRGTFKNPKILGKYNDNELVEMVKQYEYLLKYDPCRLGKDFDKRFMVIHPHCLNTVISLTPPQYSFIRRAIGLYCNGLVSISPSVKLL